MKAAAVGTFDGVHLGHQFLLRELREAATARGLEPLAVTFAEHPLRLMAPDRVPALIIPPSRRTELLQAQGVEVQVLDFNAELQQMTAREFLQMLHDRYGVRLFLLGFNNRIGSDRCGAETLGGQTIGGVEVLAASEHPELTVSSSLIRDALAKGDVERAARLLGRPFAIDGEVVRGKQLGRTIGFPTANLLPLPGISIPATGVYLGQVSDHKAVVNIGHRPTVDSANSPLSIEAHILDFSGDLYNQQLSLRFLRRLRGEQKFPSLAALQTQIQNDIALARTL